MHVRRTTQWEGPTPKLASLDIELTERCQNNCLHCCINLPGNDDAAKSRELSTDDWSRILAEAAGLGCLRVRFTGGEPLLREDFAALYERARRLGMRVAIFTNARLITAELADLFARMPPGEPVEVTVYGMSAASCDAATRAPGAFAEFRRGVDLLEQRRVPFVLKGALLPPNRHERAALESWAATIPWMRGEPPSVSAMFQLRARRDDDAKNRLIASLRSSPAEMATLASAERDRLARFCRQFLGPQGTRLFACGAGNDVCVDAYGRVQPCLAMRAPELTCDWQTTGLRGALEEFFPSLRKLEATDPEYLRRCARCFLRGLCEQCPALSWSEHGVLDKPVEYFCAVAHAQARALGLLSDGEQSWDVTDWRARLKRLENVAPVDTAAVRCY